MTLCRRLIAGLRGMFHKAQIEREMDEELRGYFDTATEQKIPASAARKPRGRRASKWAVRKP